MSNQLNPFVWREIRLSESVFIDSVPHFTRLAIGQWLGFADPRKGVDTSLRRNPHIKPYPLRLYLIAADGKHYETFVYDPVAFMHIVMGSRQPKAKAMKAAVSEFASYFYERNNQNKFVA